MQIQRRSSTRARALSTAGALLAALLAAPAFAQVDVVGADPPPEGAPPTSLLFGYQHQFQTDIGNHGKFSREAVIARGIHMFDLGDSVKLMGQASYQGHYYDFTNSAAPFSWSDIHQGTVAGVLMWKVADHWSLLGAGLVRSTGEGGAKFGDTITAGGGVGFVYRSSPDFRVGVLLGALSQLEDSASLLPLPVLDWKFADDWKLHLGVNIVSSVGYGGEISYEPSESWTLATGFSYERWRYRLDDGGANADGVAEERSLPIYAKIGFHPSKDVDLSVVGDVATGGKLRVEGQSGRKIRQKSYDPAPGVSFQATFRF